MTTEPTAAQAKYGHGAVKALAEIMSASRRLERVMNAASIASNPIDDFVTEVERWTKHLHGHLRHDKPRRCA